MLEPRNSLTVTGAPRALLARAPKALMVALALAAAVLAATVMLVLAPAPARPWVGAVTLFAAAGLGAFALVRRRRAPPPPLPPEVVREREARELELESLTSLHAALEDLVEDPRASEPFTRLLTTVEAVSGARSSAVFVIEQGAATMFAATSKDARARLQPALEHLAGQARPAGGTGFREFSLRHHRYLAAELRGEGLDYGLLVAEFAPGSELDRSRRRLLETLAGHLARTICGTRRALRNRRRDLLQERAAIARELHDSLAQSLSYLKIQSSRLQAQLDRDRDGGGANYAQLDAISRELRQNLNLAYGQLRELMTTFRLTMNGKDLTQAVEESISEFEKRSTIAFDADLRIDPEQLTAHEELQVLHIVREALANIVRHSHATRASISVLMGADNTVTIRIRDDGIGFTHAPSVHQHHGLMIMQERARALKGELRVSGERNEGTSIDVTFKPEQVLVNLAPQEIRHER